MPPLRFQTDLFDAGYVPRIWGADWRGHPLVLEPYCVLIIHLCFNEVMPISLKHLDLTIPELAYLLGFLQTDGTMAKESRNRGRIVVEVSKRDRDILRKLKKIIPVYSSLRTRKRDTNFKKDHNSVIWRVFDQSIRELFNLAGLPYGKKSDLVCAPNVPFSKPDYYRGIIDGDGSLGFTSAGFPFLSLTTASSSLVDSYLTYLFSLTGKKKILHPNKRDAVYNPCVFKEDAQTVAKNLYYEGCLSLDRKKRLAHSILLWQRPNNMRKRGNFKHWTPEEDAVVKRESTTIAANLLGRTEISIRVRASRIRKRK